MKNKYIFLVISLFAIITLIIIFVFNEIRNANVEINRFNIDKILTLDFLLNYKIDKLSNDKINRFESKLEQYISDNYNEVKKIFIVDYKGVDLNNDVNDSLIVKYDVKVPFMQETFRITIGYDTNEIFGDTFYEVLSRDPKFQHLYSEWVKKQVGIEDENVEFGFTGNFDKPYIEFDKITSLSDDYREVFENIHNLYCWYCELNNINDLSNDSKDDIARKIRREYLLPAIKITKMPLDKKFGGRIELSNDNNNYIFNFDITSYDDNTSELKCRTIKKSNQ